MPGSRLRSLSRLAVPILALALGAVVALALVSCGSRDTKGLLPGDTAGQIVSNLDQIEQDASEGSCTSAAEEVAAVQDQIQSLPASVDSQLRARLEDGASRLADVVNSPGACETTPTSTTTSTSTESTTKPKTKSTTTTPTTTTTTSSTTSTPTATFTNPTGGTGTPGGTPVPPPAPGPGAGTGTP
jgi:hypothetical protein